jgi:hypothetical protein
LRRQDGAVALSHERSKHVQLQARNAEVKS